MASVPAAKAAKDAVASEGLVTTYELENTASPVARPDEGVVYAYEDSAVVKDALLFAVAPKSGLAVRLKLADECKLDDASLDQLSARIKEIAEKPNLGPRVGESPSEYPLKDAVDNTKAKNARDSRIWESVMSGGGASGGAQLGIFIRRNNFGRPQDLWAVCISSVSAQVYREYVDNYLTPNLGKITFRELVGSRPYKQLVKATRRNANHMLAEFLIELSLLDTVSYSQDDRSISSALEVHSPRLNKLEVDCMWNVFARMDDKKVGFYAEVVARKRCHGKGTIRILHPVQGIALFGYDKSSRERDPSGGHALTPKRSSGEDTYDKDKVNKSYVAAGTAQTVTDWVALQSFVGVNTRSLSAPAGTQGLHMLEPVQVLVA